MNVGQIRFLVTAVELGSFSQAARRHGVTVQAVSKAIKGLEAQLGNELFVRENRGGVSLTDFGQKFYERACDVLRGFDALEGFAREYATGQRGDTVLLALDSPPFNNYEHVCSGIAQRVGRHIGLELRVMLTDSEDAYQRLESGSVDGVVSLGRNRLREDLDHLPLGTVTPGVAMLPEHPLAAKDVLSLADLAAFEIAYPVNFHTFSCEFDEAFARLGLSPRVMWNAGSADVHDVVENCGGLVPCVGLSSIVQPDLHYTVRPVRDDGFEKVPVLVDTLKGFKSPQYRECERRMRASGAHI